MKGINLLALLIVTITACNDAPAPVEPVELDLIITDTPDTPVAADDTTEMRIQIPESTSCYRYATKKDTVFLKVEKFPNVVTGILTYQLLEKDKNKGELDGVLKGDTLVADYTFMSEGVMSRRQVIFLFQNNVATEGYGEMEEKDGKMVFRDGARIDFIKGLKLRKVPCEN